MPNKKHIIKYKSKLLRKSWLLLLGFILFFGVANAGSIDVHKKKGNAENNTLPVEYALLGTDYAVTNFVTYANSASEVPPVIRKYSSYFGIVYTMGRIGGSLYSSAKLATAEEAAFAESAAKASTSEITTEETATATTVTSTEEKVTATSTEETAPTTPAMETTASEGTTTGTTTKENVPVETKTTVINDGSVAKGAEELIDVAKATEKQLDDVFARISKEPPFEYTPNTIEHKAERWAQYKLSKGDAAKEYNSWSNIYNSNMNKANIAKQVELDYMNSIGWGKHQVSIKAGNQTRRMDIADELKLKGVEIKSYETGKVYGTEAIRLEATADKYLIQNDGWQIEWVFKGCEPSQPLKALLEEAGITIKLIP